jgi:hypothetical protein
MGKSYADKRNSWREFVEMGQLPRNVTSLAVKSGMKTE